MSGTVIRSMETTHKSLLLLRSKVVIVGAEHVGKSAVTRMFYKVGQEYPKDYVMTIGVDFCVKVVNIPDTNAAVELYLYDTTGQWAIFNQKEQLKEHWENAAHVIVVYDVSNRQSFDMCAKWLQSVRRTRPGKAIPGVLLANKIDLREEGRAVVTREEGVTFARQNNLDYFECSAKTGTDVDAPFNFLASEFHKKYEEAVSRTEHMI